jgi:diketogulonate reductase-like aldo/keto reductase/predicted dehydrogenase
MSAVPLQSKVNCVFVGAGSVAKRYADGLAESSLCATGVCDLDEGRAMALADGLESATPYTDLEGMLAAESAPLVVNVSSHGAHAAVTRTCLAAGRHVFSEKPIALAATDARSLVDLAAERDLALGCAPENYLGDAQRHARRLLDDGRLGSVRFASATANVGRVGEWHDRPASFLAVGPLYDGAVYPLSLLCAWFGRVECVRRADALDVWPGDDAPAAAGAAPHVEATIEFADGPVVALRASFYVDHRSREFYGLELHGDDGTLYLDDTGALAASRDAVTVRGGDREPTTAPHPAPRRERGYVAGPEALARSVERGRPARSSARRAAHVVAICEAIDRAAAEGGAVAVGDDAASTASVAVEPTASSVRLPWDGGEPADGNRAMGSDEDRDDGRGQVALGVPPVGFGCSRYRGGDRYVDPALGAAVDAGYRFFDTAELYGNEWRLGDLLGGPGGPDRESVFLLGKPWRTNHGPGDLRRACEGSLAELDVDSFDCYALHWPGSWAHQGDLRELSKRPVAERDAVTFPTDETGAPRTAPHSLLETWTRMEQLREDGLARTLGICNVTLPQLAGLVDDARVPPAVVQVERHPYRPRRALVEWCRRRGMTVVAHSPLSAPGLLEDSVVESVAEDVGLTPAQAVLAWNVTRGVVPIPSSTSREHVVQNLASARHRLDDESIARLDDLADPAFER